MHDTMNKMKKLVFSLAAVAMAAVASVNVYNVNANAVEMSDLQKENVEALANGEKKTPCIITVHATKKRSTILRAACHVNHETQIVLCQRGGKDICTPKVCQHIYE
jgi:hypothetical protein